MAITPTRHASIDSLDDVENDDFGAPSSSSHNPTSRQRQLSVVSARSARTARSTQSNLSEAEAREWKRSIAEIHNRSAVEQGLEGENEFSPKTSAAASLGYQSADVSPTQSTFYSPGLPDPDFPPSFSDRFSAVTPPYTTASMSSYHHSSANLHEETIRESDEEEQEDDDQHLPSFTAPAPAHPPSSLEESPRSTFRNTLRASMSIPAGRPTYTSANSTGPLLGDSSAVNTPMSAVSDPFNDRKQSDVPEGSNSISTTPDMNRGSRNVASGLVPPTINLIPNSPASQGSATIPQAPAVPLSPMSQTSPFGTAFPAPYGNSHSMYREQSGHSLSANDRRISLAPSAGTLQSGISGLSATSALDRSKPSTIAERRSQRMKQVMSKRGKKERDSKLVGAQTSRKPFQSTRLKEEIYKPWLEKKDPAQRWARWITLFSIFIGFAVMGVSEYPILHPSICKNACIACIC